jgi:hypothetical protein
MKTTEKTVVDVADVADSDVAAESLMCRPKIH